MTNFCPADVGHAYRTVDQIKALYHKSLGPGGYELPSAFAPTGDTSIQKENILQTIRSLEAKFATMLETWTEADLDTYQLPHPLIGQLTLRVMITFNVLHVDHHIGEIKGYLQEN